MKDFMSMEYYFGEGGKVEIHYDSKINKFISIFSAGVDNSNKEWFARICNRYNAYLVEGNPPDSIYTVIETDKITNKKSVTTKVHKNINVSKFIIDSHGNLHIYNKKDQNFDIILNNKEIEEVIKQLHSIVKNNKEQVEIVL